MEAVSCGACSNTAIIRIRQMRYAVKTGADLEGLGLALGCGPPSLNFQKKKIHLREQFCKFFGFIRARFARLLSYLTKMKVHVCSITTVRHFNFVCIGNFKVVHRSCTFYIGAEQLKPPKYIPSHSSFSENIKVRMYTCTKNLQNS